MRESTVHLPSFDTDSAEVLWWLTDIQRSITQAAMLLPDGEADDYVEARLIELLEGAPQGDKTLPRFWQLCERFVRVGVEAELDQARHTAASAGGMLQ